MLTSPFPLRFVPRETPLAAVAAAFSQEGARALFERWSADATWEPTLRAAASARTLIVFGELEQLPWVDGVAYLGVDPDAPRLLLPTSARPDFPPALLERALPDRFPRARLPAALLTNPLRLVEASAPTPLDVSALRRWLEGPVA